MDSNQQQQAQSFLGSAFTMPDFAGSKFGEGFDLQQQPQQHSFQTQQQQQQQPHHAPSRSMSQLEADVAFFASSGRSSFSGSSASLSPRSNASSALGHHNALGLLEGAEVPDSSAMEHSQSMSGLDFVVLSNPQLRRTSISDLSDASRSSFSGASSQHSHHSFGGEHSPRSFTPLQSPLRDLSSLSGLALGTPVRQSTNLSYGPSSARSSPGADNAESDEQHLLSLSQDGSVQGPAKPVAPPMKRRDTALAHSLYTHGGRTDVDDDVTPMPPSTGRFVGQRAAADLHNSVVGAPFTPSQQSSTSRISVGSAVSSTGSIYQTPAQSHSSATTPLSQAFESPFGFGGPFDGASPGSLPQGKSLEAMWAQREMQMQMGMPSPHGSATGLAGPFEPTPSPRSSISGPSHFEHGMMSRTVSAPFSLPHGHPMGPPAPSTPARNTMPPTLYSGAFTAPLMRTSHSSGSLASPLAVSPMSLADRSLEGGMPLPSPGGSLHRAPSSASRTGRSRNTGPPPLIVSSADKLHVCHCGKRFKRMEHLKRHNRTHTQERPHRCPFDSCGKWFGRSDNLAQHLKTHFRAVGNRSAELLALTKGEESEPRHDPHAAAAAAARAAERKVTAGLAHGKKRSSTISTFSSELGGPISLAAPDSVLLLQQQQQQRNALTPTGGVSVNSSPNHQHMQAKGEQPGGVPSWA